MSISVQIYSNANSNSRAVTFDFIGNILVAADTALPANVSGNSFYFQITAGATQDNNVAFPVKIVRGLDELVLNKNNQSALNAYSTNSYSDIKSMIVDYTYDYINGHTANEGGSGCTAQRPMKFK